MTITLYIRIIRVQHLDSFEAGFIQYWPFRDSVIIRYVR